MPGSKLWRAIRKQLWRFERKSTVTPTRFRTIFSTLAFAGLLSATAFTSLGEWATGSRLAARDGQAPAGQQPAPPPAGRSGGDPRISGGRGGPGQQPIWWNDPVVRKEIGLSVERARAIDDIYKKRVNELTPMADELDRQRTELDKMTKAATVDFDTYQFQVLKVESLRSRLNESRIMLLYRIYKQLQPEQNKKLRDLWDRQAAERQATAGRQGGAERQGPSANGRGR